MLILTFVLSLGKLLPQILSCKYLFWTTPFRCKLQVIGCDLVIISKCFFTSQNQIVIQNQIQKAQKTTMRKTRRNQIVTLKERKLPRTWTRQAPLPKALPSVSQLTPHLTASTQEAPQAPLLLPCALSPSLLLFLALLLPHSLQVHTLVPTVYFYRCKVKSGYSKDC